MVAPETPQTNSKLVTSVKFPGHDYVRAYGDLKKEKKKNEKMTEIK